LIGPHSNWPSSPFIVFTKKNQMQILHFSIILFFILCLVHSNNGMLGEWPTIEYGESSGSQSAKPEGVWYFI
jgi:hypothetical protein